MNPSDLAILPLDADNAAPTAACVARLYPRDNTIARALGFTEDEYRPIAERTVDSTLELGAGLVVVDPATAAIHGFYFVRDLVDHLPTVAAMEAADDPRLRAWGEMHARLLAAYTAEFGAAARGDVLYLSVMALDQHARGRGLMHQLTILAATRFGIERGYRAVLGVATHPRSLAYSEGMQTHWSHALPFSDLTDPRLRALPGAAQIHRYELT